MSDTGHQELRRELTLLDSTMINVGSMVASAIFIVPTSIAAQIESSLVVVLGWVVGGIISLFGALAIAELGALMPRAGGQYVFLREAFSPLWGFLYGWTAFVVIISGSISAIAVAFATYLGYFFPMDSLAIKTVAIASILFLTVINCFGVKLGAMVQNGFTFVKIAALGALILLSFLLSGGSAANFSPLLPSVPASSLLGSILVAMIAVLWAYDGWIEITFVAGEVIQPEKNIHRSLLLSTAIVVALYVAINLGYIYVLGLEKISQSQLVASDAATVLMGPTGAAFVVAAVVISTFGANNGFIITGARIYYAMAKQRLFFRPFASVHAYYSTPIPSLLGQGIWASVLVLTGTYEQLFTYVVFASWVFYAMACGAVFILRKRWPERDRPYRTWGFPYTSIIFILFASVLVVSSIWQNPRDSLIGVGMIVSGIPMYLFWSGKIRNADRVS